MTWVVVKYLSNILNILQFSTSWWKTASFITFVMLPTYALQHAQHKYLKIHQQNLIQYIHKSNSPLQKKHKINDLDMTVTNVHNQLTFNLFSKPIPIRKFNYTDQKWIHFKLLIQQKHNIFVILHVYTWRWSARPKHVVFFNLIW
jgi:hypothetical protein